MRRTELAPSRLQGAHIVIVDDTAENLRLLERILAYAGYTSISTESDPLAAVELIASTPTDLVLLDLRMPVMDGFGVLRELRQRLPDEPYLPVVVLTADADPDVRRRALASGAEDFLTKPFDAQEVLLRCRNLLETRFLHLDAEARADRLSETVAERSLELTEARDAHVAVLDALGRLSPHETAEETAAALCREVAERGGFDGVALLAFTASDVLMPLATAGPLAPDVTAGRALPSARTRYLREHARGGPWVQPWDDTRTTSEHGYAGASGIRAVLYAPITDGELIGLLAVATGDPAGVDALTHRLSTVVDHAAIAKALIGPAIRARRTEGDARSSIRRIIADETFHPVFQPIVHLGDESVIGYEALTRFDDGTRPDIRFAEAESLGLGVVMEEAALRAAIDASERLPLASWLSLNVSPEMLLDAPRLDQLLHEPSRLVVLEVTEHVAVEEYARLRAAIGRLTVTTRLAIDDAGAGFASFRHIVELQPDYVKLDLALVRSIEKDPMRQALVTALRYFASKTGCTLIAEGIETEAERSALRELGVSFGQGFLLGRPARPRGAGSGPGD